MVDGLQEALSVDALEGGGQKKLSMRFMSVTENRERKKSCGVT
jgi:hypothetical protein